MRNRALLLIAYLLLVAVTAWTSFDIRRALSSLEDDLCGTAEIIVANELVSLFVLTDESSRPSETDDIVAEYVDLATALQEHCDESFSDLLDETPG